ncbi:MAG: hypothetical protein JXD22_13500 [Sedimentisphaerales bacterium]|nr:hypothetical protein [Sedimentisphaerales bacterium]
MSFNLDVVVAGDICLDIIPQFPVKGMCDIGNFFVPSKLINVGAACISTGGPVGNAGLAMKKLGLNVRLMSRIGDDFMGREVLDRVAAAGLENQLTVLPNAPTSYTIALVLGDVDRMYLHCNGTNDFFSSADIDYNIVKQARAFHLGYPPILKNMYENQGEQLIEIFKKVKSLGLTTVMDLSLPDPGSPSAQVNWKKLLSNLLPFVDIILPGISETAFMLDKNLYHTRRSESDSQDPVLAYRAQDYQKLSKTMIDMGAKIVGLKSGICGFYLKTADHSQLQQLGRAAPTDLTNWANRQLWAPSFKMHPFCSAIGSGDSAVAGFLAAFLRGFNPEQTVQITNTVGGQNVRGLDAISTIDDWPTTLEMFNNQQRPRNPLTINDPNWRYNDSQKIYLGPDDSSTK